MRKHIISSIFILLLISILIFNYKFSELYKIDNAINKAINFLYNEQNFYGEFETKVCYDKSKKQCDIDSSPFVTTYVLYSLKDIAGYKVKIMKDKAMRFLLEEQESSGLWKYSSSRNPINRKEDIPPDVDTTSVVSFILEKNKVTFIDNKNQLFANRNDKGLFQLWMMYDKKYKEMKDHMLLENATNGNLIDCTVNANAIIYLNDPSVTEPVCKYINQEIESDGCYSQYYKKKLLLYYTIAKAYENGILCFNTSKKKIIKEVLEKVHYDEVLSDTDIALSLNILVIFGYKGYEINSSVLQLLQKQNSDGSWDEDVLFVGISEPVEDYYSKAASTGWTIEALQRYKKTLKNE